MKEQVFRISKNTLYFAIFIIFLGATGLYRTLSISESKINWLECVAIGLFIAFGILMFYYYLRVKIIAYDDKIVYFPIFKSKKEIYLQDLSRIELLNDDIKKLRFVDKNGEEIIKCLEMGMASETAPFIIYCQDKKIVLDQIDTSVYKKSKATIVQEEKILEIHKKFSPSNFILLIIAIVCGGILIYFFRKSEGIIWLSIIIAIIILLHIFHEIRVMQGIKIDKNKNIIKFTGFISKQFMISDLLDLNYHEISDESSNTNYIIFIFRNKSYKFYTQSKDQSREIIENIKNFLKINN